MVGCGWLEYTGMALRSCIFYDIMYVFGRRQCSIYECDPATAAISNTSFILIQASVISGVVFYARCSADILVMEFRRR